MFVFAVISVIIGLIVIGYAFFRHNGTEDYAFYSFFIIGVALLAVGSVSAIIGWLIKLTSGG